MSKSFLAWVPKNPIESILLTKAICLAFYATWFMLPVSLHDPGVISTVFNTQEEHVLIGIVLLAPAIYTIYAFCRKSLDQMHAGVFAIMLAWLFLTLLRIIIFGFLPISGWLLFLMPAVTSAICYLTLGNTIEGKRGRKR
jgi:hypothetical protein